MNPSESDEEIEAEKPASEIEKTLMKEGMKIIKPDIEGFFKLKFLFDRINGRDNRS